MNAFSNLSNISKEQTKLESSLYNNNTQRSFHSQNNRLFHTMKNESKSKTFTPHFKCTCRPNGLNTVLRRGLKFTCKKNLFKGHETDFKIAI